MPSYYKQLVDSLGEDGAKARMREIRAKVVNPGFKSMDAARVSEIASMGGKSRWPKHETKEKTVDNPTEA